VTPPGSPPTAVAIVGLGCIGGSIALGLRRALPGVALLGVDRDPATLASAEEQGAIDRGLELGEAAAVADCVVLAVPVLAVEECLRTLAAGSARAGRRSPLLVTDTASTKGAVCRWGDRWLGPQSFLGGHPMAGRERSGFAAATPTLFHGCRWALTPTAPADLDRFGPWLVCLEALGARPLVLPADRHDALVARTSHLPLVLAHLCAAVAAAASDDSLAAALVGSGFRDVARMAAGDPTMAAHIAASNAAALDDALAAAEAELGRLRRILQGIGAGPPPPADDPAVDALRSWFAAARAARAALLPAGPPDAS